MLTDRWVVELIQRKDARCESYIAKYKYWKYLKQRIDLAYLREMSIDVAQSQ